MEGIFRKPPKNSTLRELKEKLDAGCEIELEGVSPSVSASLLKVKTLSFSHSQDATSGFFLVAGIFPPATRIGVGQ